MHVHAVWDKSVYKELFADFVAYGVVGIRDMGGDPNVLPEARRYLSFAENIGPELIAAGQVLDGPSPIHPEISTSVESFEEGVRAVEFVAIRSNNLTSLFWVGRTDNAAAFGNAWDQWRSDLTDPKSVASKLWTRFLDCSTNVARRGYDVY